MAGTVTTTESAQLGSVKKVAFAWTSSSGGAADATTAAVYDGKLIGLATIPDGTSAPTDNYDVSVKDGDGHDVLLGAGQNRDATATEYVDGGSLGGVAGSKLTLAVSGAGDTKKGTVILYIR